MNFIVIDSTVSRTRGTLLKEKRLLRKILSKSDKPEFKGKLKVVEDKLLLLSRAEKYEDRKSDYQKIESLRLTKPKRYDSGCRALCKEVRGISFIKKTRQFRVQRTIDGARVYAGAYQSFDDAVEGLELLINNK